MNTQEKQVQKTLKKYSKELCLKAFKIHEIDGCGANTIGNLLEVTTNTADTLIDVGRILNNK